MFQRNVFLTLEEEMNVSLTCLSMKFIYDICFKICVKELKKLCEFLDLTFKICHEVMLSLLYHEAKFNVIEGRYVVQPEEYDQLAGIQALIHLEHYNANTHTQDHYKYVLPSG